MTISRVTVRGFRIGVRVDERVPYGLIRLGSSDSPVEFVVVLHFDHAEEPGKTDFSIDIDANLNLMMRSMLGSKVQQGLDALVDGLVAASEGRMPEMPEDFPPMIPVSVRLNPLQGGRGASPHS